jgi:hypothetical protein
LLILQQFNDSLRHSARHDIFEALEFGIHFGFEAIKTSVDLFEPLVDLLKPAIDLLKAFLNLLLEPEQVEMDLPDRWQQKTDLRLKVAHAPFEAGHPFFKRSRGHGNRFSYTPEYSGSRRKNPNRAARVHPS